MIMEIGSDIANVIVSDHMPIGIPEQVIQNHDGSFSIFLNGKYNFEKQKSSLEHAIDHIRNGDFEKEDVQQIELEAHHLHEPVVHAPVIGRIPDEWLTGVLLRLMARDIQFAEWKADRERYERYFAPEYDEARAMRDMESMRLYEED